MNKEKSLEGNEAQLGRERSSVKQEYVSFDNATEAREAFLSDSKYQGKVFDLFTADLLIADGAVNVVARNLHRFPKEFHSEIIERLSETDDGKAALGLG